MSEFQIRRDDLTQTRIVAAGNTVEDFQLDSGDILVKIDRFAFTANNITYGAVGDQIGYWQFFPPSSGDNGEDTDGWGILPVWGFADVVVSNTEGLPVGERLYGYFPPADFLKMTPKGIGPSRFTDAAEHRSALPPGYNMYRRVTAEPGYDPSMDNERALLYPLHITSFCLWDALKDKNWHGAEQILILSASSKTSIGLAYALADDKAAPQTTAVTSSRNIGLVKRLGLYGHQVTYDNLTDIDANVPAVIVDMSGNLGLLAKLHTHLGGNMKHCINVGMTHWEEFQSKEGADGIITERSEFFFAPGHIQKRMADWGPAEFNERTGSFMHATALRSRDWLTCTPIDGLQGLADIFADVSGGRIAPDQGLIISL
ncbi:MAG: hypothetical protein COB37_00370 [Kordiimonadales bacterium]|nr:MAG: hypothetical protein COB37_00370 [Kordiimonadales bacterium]